MLAKLQEKGQYACHKGQELQVFSSQSIL